MSDKVFLGTRMAQLDTSPALAPVSKVILAVDSENAYIAGDDTGRTVEVTCPYGTQEMANNILSALSSYTYTPAMAQDAILDPAAEIGDGLTMGGVYTVLAQSTLTFDGLMTSDAGAPGQAEQESEYKYQSPVIADINWQLAETRSLISKTSEEILLKVENELEGLSSSFSVQLRKIQSQVTGLDGQMSSITQTVSSITSQVNGLDGQVSTIEQKVDNITLSVSNGSTSSSISLSVGGVTVSSQTIQMNGLVTFTGLANGTTTVDGACIKTGIIEASRIDTDSLYVNAANITGSLTIGQLPNNVATTGDIPDKVSELENDEGYQTERGVVTIIDGTVDADYVNALGIRARYLQGETVQLLSSSGSLVGAMDIVNTNTGDGLTIGTNRGGIRIETGQSGNIYISSSYGPFLMLGYGDTGSTAMCQLGGGPLVIPGASYGSRAPSGSGEYGQVYFQLE